MAYKARCVHVWYHMNNVHMIPHMNNVDIKSNEKIIYGQFKPHMTMYRYIKSYVVIYGRIKFSNVAIHEHVIISS